MSYDTRHWAIRAFFFNFFFSRSHGCRHESGDHSSQRWEPGSCVERLLNLSPTPPQCLHLPMPFHCATLCNICIVYSGDTWIGSQSGGGLNCCLLLKHAVSPTLRAPARGIWSASNSSHNWPISETKDSNKWDIQILIIEFMQWLLVQTNSFNLLLNCF